MLGDYGVDLVLANGVLEFDEVQVQILRQIETFARLYALPDLADAIVDELVLLDDSLSDFLGQLLVHFLDSEYGLHIAFVLIFIR